MGTAESTVSVAKPGSPPSIVPWSVVTQLMPLPLLSRAVGLIFIDISLQR